MSKKKSKSKKAKPEAKPITAVETSEEVAEGPREIMCMDPTNTACQHCQHPGKETSCEVVCSVCGDIVRRCRQVDEMCIQCKIKSVKEKQSAT